MWRIDRVFDPTLISSLDSYLQLVAADVVDDEDVEPDSEENDADDADDLEGLVEEVHGEVLRCGDGPVSLRLRLIVRVRGGGGGHLSTNWLSALARARASWSSRLQRNHDDAIIAHDFLCIDFGHPATVCFCSCNLQTGFTC